MTPSVRATLGELAAGRFDILVIGGGITGAGIAREAALRGMAVALVEAKDIGEGTSSKSSRLIHGGLRYLEQGRFHLVREALRERQILLRLAPHLVRPIPFLFPTFQGERVPRWKLATGLTLYDLFAVAGGNVRRHRTLGKRAVLAEEPLLRERGLTGGAIYYDAQCDDARMTVAVARAAAGLGARISNHMRLTGFIRTVGGIAGAYVRDELTGEEGEVRARCVVNATGPWVDAVRRLEDPQAASLLRPTKGVHIVVPRSRLGHQHAITFTSPVDGRVMFVLPWGEWSYIGTTDTDTSEPADAVSVHESDVVYLLRSVNALFPGARLSEEDVTATWAGLRPLVAADPGRPTSAISREHRILRGPGGVITIAGGKLTTWRRMAEELVDGVIRSLGYHFHGRPVGNSRTDPLPGGDAANVEGMRPAGIELGLSDATVTYLLRNYGSETPAIYRSCREKSELMHRIHPEHPAIGAQVRFASEREFAITIEDVLERRLHLHLETKDRGERARPVIARLLASDPSV
ncbi:MAG: glycerol-3-phosphate dehydrogenase/oxidase [Gemmatimonadales bacterium]|nr:glycerol-3-phosphate dehydrogenase/oxidase [Gemmatimonadales bacterium]